MSEDRFTSPSPKKPPTRPPQRNILITLCIRVLRGLINQLEGIVNQLENSSSLENYRNREPKKRSLGYQLSKILSPIRRILPPAINRRLPDSILAIIIGIIFIIIFTQVFKDFPAREPSLPVAEKNRPDAKPTEIILENPSEEIPSEPTSLEQETVSVEPFSSGKITEIPSTLDEIETPSEKDFEIISKSEPEPILEVEDTPENQNKIPAVLIATAPPKAVKFIYPQTLELTPKQYLIARIQDEMGASTAKIHPEILVSVKANFSINLLQVELSESWYELTETQQNQMAQILLEQAQDFDFTRLELIEVSGKPLARTAVIGSNMVILNRMKSAT